MTVQDAKLIWVYLKARVISNQEIREALPPNKVIKLLIKRGKVVVNFE